MELDLYNANNGGGDGSNGGGGGSNGAVADLRLPDQADPHMKERQPLTWHRAAPFVAAALAGGALLAACMVLGGRSCTDIDDQGRIIVRNAECGWAVVLGIFGVIVLTFTVMVLPVSLLRCQCCCVPRLEADR